MLKPHVRSRIESQAQDVKHTPRSINSSSRHPEVNWDSVLPSLMHVHDFIGGTSPTRASGGQKGSVGLMPGAVLPAPSPEAGVGTSAARAEMEQLRHQVVISQTCYVNSRS